MTLKLGTSNANVAFNMKELVKTGFSKKQAAAIAYSKAGRRKKKNKYPTY